MAGIYGIGAAVAGGAANIFGSFLNRSWAAQQAETDRRRNYEYGEAAANNADVRQRSLYRDLYSPGAMLNQYMDAGLSPSLLYGNAPTAGGHSAAQGTGAGNIQTPYAPVSMLEAAQIGNLIAETNKTKAETANVEEDTKKKGAETAMINLQQSFQEIQNEIAKETKDFQVQTVEKNLKLIEEQANLYIKEAEAKKVEIEFNKETFNDRTKMIKEQVNNIVWDSLLKQAQRELNQEQIKALQTQESLMRQQINESIERIAQGWEQIAVQREGQKITAAIAHDNLQYMIGKANDEIKMFYDSLKQNKILTEKGITQGYIKLGVDVYTSAIKAAGTMFGAMILKGGMGAVSGAINTPNYGTPGVMQMGGF